MTGTGTHRRRPRKALVLFSVALSLAVTAACPSLSGDPAEPDVRPALSWFAAYQSALHQGLFTLRSFYTEDTRVDLSSLGVPTVSGRDPALQAIGGTFVPSGSAPSPEQQRIYLSPTGAVEAAPIEESASDPHRLVAIDEMGATGLVRQVFAVSELAWRAGFPDDPRTLTVHQLAQRYAQAWAAGSSTAVTRLYSQDATLADGLDGVWASSREAIAALASRGPLEGGLPGVAIDQLPDLSGPAVFAVVTPDLKHASPARSATLLVTARGPDGCPGHMAVTLGLDALGTITRETRYHRTDSLAGCVPSTPAGGGPGEGGPAVPWWESITIPPAVTKVKTAEVTIGGATVPVFNSTPGMEGLVTWAAQRFSSAGLVAPTLTEVAFYDPHADVCRNVRGLALGGSVTMCFIAQNACADARCSRWTPRARSTILHELGHVWMSQDKSVDSEVTAAFTEKAGLASWADTADHYGQRGVELAGETIAWALIDEPVQVNPDFGERSCEELAALFQTLTGKPVPQAAPCQADAVGRDVSR